MRDIRTFCLFRRFIIARRLRRQSERSPLATPHVQPKARSVYAASTLRVQRIRCGVQHIRCDASIDEDRHPVAARTLDAAVARPSALSSRRGAPRRELREYQVPSSN